MKLRRIVIDQFRLWRHVELRPLRAGIQVIYGPNETGKTTLRHFIQAVLFGPTTDTLRDIYADSVREEDSSADGHVCGGRIECSHAGRRYWLKRSWDGTDQTGHATSITTLQGQELFTTVDQLFNISLPKELLIKIFFLDLRELQELALLQRNEIAEHFFSTSLSLIGVSFSQVLRAVEDQLTSLAGPHVTGELRLIAEKLRSCQEELRRLRKENQIAQEVSGRLQQINQQQKALDAQAERLRQKLSVYEQAVTLIPLWQQKQALTNQLSHLGEVPPSLPKVAPWLERLEKHEQALRDRQEKLKRKVAELRSILSHSGPAARWPLFRTEILRLLSRKKMAFTIEERLSRVERRTSALSHLWEKLLAELPATVASDVNCFLHLSEATRRALRHKAQELINHTARLVELTRRLEEAQAQLAALRRQLAGELGDLPPEDISQRIEELARQLERLRRHQLSRQRLRELGELERLIAEEYQRLHTQPALSRPIQLFLRIGMGASVLVIIASVFAPVSAAWIWGWPLLGVGGLGLSLSILFRYFLEVSHRRKVMDCAEQLAHIRSCMGEYIAHPAAGPSHSANHPPSGGERLPGPPPIGDQQAVTPEEALATDEAGRLEEELRKLQRLAPQQAAIARQAERVNSLAHELTQAQEHLAQLKETWSLLCTKAGLPAELSPDDLLASAPRLGRLQKVARLRRQAERRRAKILRRLNRWHERLCALERQLASADSLAPDRPPGLVDHLCRLAQLSEQAENDFRRARQVKVKLRHTLRQLRKLGQRLKECRRQQARHLRKLGLSSREALTEALNRTEEAARLRNELARLEEQMVKEIRGVPSGEVFDLLAQEDTERLEASRRQLEEQLRAITNDLQKLANERSHWEARYNQLSSAKQWWEAQGHSRFYRRRLRELCHKALCLEALQQGLKGACQELERTYQPPTLRIASQLLARFTLGRYRRLWSPLDRPELLVDDALGRTWQIEELSQGTCDQIYICIRLALGALLASRGVELPFLLDDVLVHFDHRRLEGAAEALIDWTSQGYQLLLFTCHPHVVKAFARHGVPVFFLPKPTEAHGENVASADHWHVIRPRRFRKTSSGRKPAAFLPQNRRPHFVCGKGDPACSSETLGPDQKTVLAAPASDRSVEISESQGTHTTGDEARSPDVHDGCTSNQKDSPKANCGAAGDLSQGEVLSQDCSDAGTSSASELPHIGTFHSKEGVPILRLFVAEAPDGVDPTVQDYSVPPNVGNGILPHRGRVQPDERGQEQISSSSLRNDCRNQPNPAKDLHTHQNPLGCAGEADWTPIPAEGIPVGEGTHPTGETPDGQKAPTASSPSGAPTKSKTTRPRVEYYGPDQGSFDAFGRPLGPREG